MLLNLINSLQILLKINLPDLVLSLIDNFQSDKESGEWIDGNSENMWIRILTLRYRTDMKASQALW